MYIRMQTELFLELDMEITRKADRTEAAEDNSAVLRVNQVKVKQGQFILGVPVTCLE